MEALQMNNPGVTPLDALWALFLKLPKKDRITFARRIAGEESSENLKAEVVRHIKAVRGGKEKTCSFDSLAEAKKWLEE